MASVRMSHQLRNDILKTAMDQFDIANPKPVFNEVNTVLDAITNMPTLKHLRALHTSEDMAFLNENSQGSFKLDCRETRFCLTSSQNITGCSLQSRYNQNLNPQRVEFHSPLSIIAPATNWDRWNEFENTPRIYMEDFTQDDCAKIEAIVTNHQDAVKKHEEEKYEYKHKIRNLLEECNTVKQLLDAWPGAESLVPRAVVVQMHEKVTRKSRAKAIKEKVEFDDAEVNNVILTAKIMGA